MNANRLDDLRARLRAPSNKIPASFQRLGNALWNSEKDAVSHEQCRAALPALILAQVMGERLTEQMLPVKHHLDHCDECGTEYAELLDLALAEQRGAVAQPAKMPRPDLEFLPTPQATLEARVIEWTRSIVREITPKGLAELDAVARLFFNDLKLHQAHEQRAMYMIAPSTEPTKETGVQVLLLASYATTELLVERVKRAEFDTWTSRVQIKSHVRMYARDTARTLGLTPQARTIFSKAYAEVVVRAPSALRDLLH